MIPFIISNNDLLEIDFNNQSVFYISANEFKGMKIGDKYNKETMESVHSLLKQRYNNQVNIVLFNPDEASSENLQSILVLIEQIPDNLQIYFITENIYSLPVTLRSRSIVKNSLISSADSIDEQSPIHIKLDNLSKNYISAIIPQWQEYEDYNLNNLKYYSEINLNLLEDKR